MKSRIDFSRCPVDSWPRRLKISIPKRPSVILRALDEPLPLVVSRTGITRCPPTHAEGWRPLYARARQVVEQASVTFCSLTKIGTAGLIAFVDTECATRIMQGAVFGCQHKVVFDVVIQPVKTVLGLFGRVLDGFELDHQALFHAKIQPINCQKLPVQLRLVDRSSQLCMMAKNNILNHWIKRNRDIGKIIGFSKNA